MQRNFDWADSSIDRTPLDQKAHGWPLHRFRNRLGVAVIVPVALKVYLHPIFAARPYMTRYDESKAVRCDQG